MAGSKQIFQAMFICCLIFKIIASLPVLTKRDLSNRALSLPNREIGLERLFGLGAVFPYPYYQKPKHRYPVYDRSGRGSLLYGYGGPETYQYKIFTPIEGHH